MPNLANFDLTTLQNQQVLQNLATYLPPAAWLRHIQANHDTVLSGSGNATQPGTLAMQHQAPLAPVQKGNLTQVQNRYATGTMTAHLLLLDLQVSANLQQANLQNQQRMGNALDSEAQNTTFVHPTQGGADISDPHLRWLLKHPAETASLLTNNPNATAQYHIDQLSSQRHQELMSLIMIDDNYAPLKHYFAATTYRTTHRFGHHEAKSAQRLSKHFQDLAGRARHLTKKAKEPKPQYVTETRGEHMAAKVLLTCLPGSSDYQLKLGFKDGGHHGIDQIWARRDRGTGAVTEYIIVEAKGSQGAHLGLAQYGEQMSAQWVFSSLMATANGQVDDRERRLARKVLTAMFDDNFNGHATAQTPGVWGMVLKSLYDHDHPNSIHQKVIAVTGLPSYNRPDLP